MGHDKHYGFQLYQSDPSGNFGGWLATCIGANAQVSDVDNELIYGHWPPLPLQKAAESILKQEYKEGCVLKEALLLAVKVLNKTMDSTSLTSDKREFVASSPILPWAYVFYFLAVVEFATLTLVGGRPHFSVLKPEQVTHLLKEVCRYFFQEFAALLLTRTV